MSLVKFVRCDGPQCDRMVPLDDAQGYGWTAMVKNSLLGTYPYLDYCPAHKEG